MRLLLMALVATAASAQTITVTVDAAANRHPIDPRIYGLAFASTAQLRDLNVPLNRSGGNAETRYNWQLNATNHAADYFFESIGEESATPGEHADTFIGQTRAAGAEAMITMPMIGWVAKLGPNRDKLASFSVAKYGPQQSTDPYMPDAGNGVMPNGDRITGNDPHDANQVADSAFQMGWLQHLTAQWGSGGVRYYLLDNEPSIWQETHRDVHPVGPTMDEVLAKMIDYAERIKSADPSALVAGPEEWGWEAYFYSGYDQQWAAAHDYASFPDRAAHGGRDALPWLLDQLHAYDAAHGLRLLDIFTVHYYPQGGEFSDDVSEAMKLRRNRSTRSLWDPTYVDESWIDDTVMLIPRLKQWVASDYPGTQIGVTEYNWGAEHDMSGATAQADVLGIFGREGLDLATRWTTPDAGTPAYNAIRIYRNYDGNRSTFGDVSVAASAPNPDDLAAFAAIRSGDGALTVMLVAKALTPVDAALHLSNFSSVTMQRWQLTANGIVRLDDVAVSSTLALPAQSVTLLVIPPAKHRRRAAPSR